MAERIAILGAGAMGAGIAQVAAAAGYPVRLFDNRPEAAPRVLQAIRQTFDRLVEKGKMTAAQADAAHGNLTAITGLPELAGADVVIEAVVEDREIKRTLFSGLEAIVGPKCLLASNTSTFSITALAAGLRHPERVVGMHFFNPAPLMALVEIVGGLESAPAQLDRAHALAIAWGKQPVRVRSTPGFIVNRAARPFYTEGMRLVAEQAADPATLDAVFRDCGSFRMGPCELTDLIGQDVNFAVTRSLFDAFFQDRRYAPTLVQRELVEAGRLGRKSGRGFFDYTSGAAASAPGCEPPSAAAPACRLRDDHPALKPLLRRLAGVDPNAAGADLAMSDGRSAAQRSREDGSKNLILFDLALDFGVAKRIALAPAPDCGPDAWLAAVAALQAAGFAVTRLRDLPGMAVLRTVCMLANECSEAVDAGVASAADVDLALRLGVNYPRGPLAWAESLGCGFVVRVLGNIGRHYGEERYRVAPRLRRALWEGNGAHD